MSAPDTMFPNDMFQRMTENMPGLETKLKLVMTFDMSKTELKRAQPEGKPTLSLESIFCCHRVCAQA